MPSRESSPTRIIIAGCTLALVLLGCTPAAASVQKIGPGLYAYISENDGSSNSTFMVTAEGILVVDTGVNDQEGAKLLAEIRRISPAPVRYIVNTHYHPDHRGGNRVVGPGATIISTAFTLAQEEGRAPAYSAAGGKITFTRTVSVFLGQEEVDVLFLGPAHTLGDAVVYFPQQRALATGDLFLTNCSPAMDRGDMENWIAALEIMLRLPLDAVVPGHFELAARPELQRFHDYLALLRDQVKPLFKEGRSVEQIQKDLDMTRFKDFRQFPQYEATFADNTAAYYGQLKAR